jgi:hypothetical protein
MIDRNRNLELLFITSDHIDVMCNNCKTAFDVREGEDIICPNCKGHICPD